MDDGWWIASAGLAVLAVAAGLGDRRQRRRNDLDSVGWVDWSSVQMGALIALAVTIGMAFHAR